MEFLQEFPHNKKLYFDKKRRAGVNIITSSPISIKARHALLIASLQPQVIMIS